MRIIAGHLKGRNFSSPHGHRTHPMSDKARGALFNALGDISGLTVLDAFAGSGALAYEAISRGALHATAIDSDRNAQRTIEENIQALGLEGMVRLIKAGAGAWFDTTDSHFDIVLLDPPYDNLQLSLLKRLVEAANLGGLVVLSWPGDMKPPELAGTDLLQENLYGDNKLVFYRKA